jgi:hypothetical protein
MEWEWIKDDNRNGTCAYLFCLVKQAVTKLLEESFTAQIEREQISEGRFLFPQHQLPRIYT